MGSRGGTHRSVPVRVPVDAFRDGILTDAPCVVTGHSPTVPCTATVRSALHPLFLVANFANQHRLSTQRPRAFGPLPFTADAWATFEQRRQMRRIATAVGIAVGVVAAVAVQSATTADDGTRSTAGITVLVGVEALFVVGVLVARRALRDRPRARLDGTGEHLLLDAVHPAAAEAIAARLAARPAPHHVTSPAAQIAPGWYPDPHDPARQRWHDGTAWTGHAHPAPSQEG